MNITTALPTTLPQLAQAVADRIAGDLDTYVYTSWGYDQTQVSFYKVIGTTPSGKSLRLRKCAKRDVAEVGNPHESVIPAHLIEGEPTITARVYGSHVTVEGQTAWLWDGRPKYQTGYGYGH